MNTPATLSDPVFDVLLALSQGPTHGYALIDRIAHAHDQAYRPGPGVIYTTLQKLSDWQWIREVAPPTTNDDPRKRFYALSQAGLLAVRTEVDARTRRLTQAKRLLGKVDPGLLA